MKRDYRKIGYISEYIDHKVRCTNMSNLCIKYCETFDGIYKIFYDLVGY